MARQSSLLVIIWGLATLYGCTTVFEALITPVYLSAGAKYHELHLPTITKAAAFMFGFNSCMAFTQLLMSSVLKTPTQRRHLLSPIWYPRVLSQILPALFAVFTLSALIYIRRLASYTTYIDRYSDTESAWEMVLFVACWSIIPLSIVFGRKWILAAVSFLVLLVTALAQVRYFALFYILPSALLFWLYTDRGAVARSFNVRTYRRAAVLLLAVFLVSGIYVWINRSAEMDLGTLSTFDIRATRLPELWLSKGFYVLLEAVDSGWAEQTKALSYERLAAGFLYPYLRYFTDYEYPRDPSTLIANIVAGFALYDIHQWVVLLYGDAYLSFGEYGIFLGLFWGLLYALLDHLMTVPLLFITFSPYSIWFLYMTFRGAVSNSIVSIPREFYLNCLFALAIAALCTLRHERVSVKTTMPASIRRLT